WDVWGGMLQPTDPLTPKALAFFDRLSELTADPDQNFAELRKMYEDPKVKVPPQVFNFLHKQMEAV
ncbi:MAG: transglutaminase domain-containing protein, partial [Alphaproteobacteria bacterium]|nr:transglutaminase domain-containing protein [Alphaproteobacteria bacterium]